MKKLFFLSVLLYIVQTTLFAQADSTKRISKYNGNFDWVMIDSSKYTKTELYAITKNWIANYWNDANTVIKNDSKEDGTITVRGSSKQYAGNSINPQAIIYYYKYNINFYFKDNKYKMTIKDVACESAIASTINIYNINSTIVCLEPFDTIPENYSVWYSISKKQATQLMIDLKNYFIYILTDYKKAIRNSKDENDSDW